MSGPVGAAPADKSGLVPGTSGFGHTYVGFPALQAWATGAVVYLAGVAVAARMANAKAVLGYSRIEETAPEGAAAAGAAAAGAAAAGEVRDPGGS